MRPASSRPSLAYSLSAALLIPSLAAAVSFDCREVITGRHKFDLSPLGGHHSVSHAVRSAPNVLNTTYTVDICQKLGRDKNAPYENQCPEGTRGKH